MSTTAAAGTRLSDLPDDLLQRILYFVPSREAASTTVLSRRWRHLWPTPWRGGAGVHLDTRRSPEHRGDGSALASRRDAFFRCAAAALDAHGPVRRLTIHVEEEEEHHYTIKEFMSRADADDYPGEDHDIDDVLTHPFCHGVEELRIEAYSSYCPFAGSKYHGPTNMPGKGVGHYNLCLGSVPSEALRELHMTNCSNLELPSSLAAFFLPCLTVLRLQSCAVSLDNLQVMMAASPQLDTLNLEYVYMRITKEESRTTYWGIRIRREESHTTTYWDYDDDDGWRCNIRDDSRGPLDRVRSFCCPTVTVLALLNCCYDESFTVKLYAPRVRHFRYSGHVNSRFPLRSPMLDLTRVDLHVFEYAECKQFWQFVTSFCNTKVLKLKFEGPIDTIAVTQKKRHDELLDGVLFSNLERLDVDAKHKAATKDAAAVAIGNLLQCCPAVAELSLKLNPEEPYKYRPDNWNASEHKRTLIDRKAQLDFRNSIDHFLRRKDQVVSFGGEDQKYEVSHLPGLTDKWFSCVQCHLKRVSLQFHLETSNGFGVQLANFFFEKAMFLEELYIDDGNQKMCKHMNRKFGGRITNPLHPISDYKVVGGISQEAGVKLLNSSKIREGLPINSRHEVRRKNQWSRGFTILPLER